VPIKTTLNAQTVFFCCQSCVDDAREHAAQTLAKVAEFKAKGKAALERR
jgi:hypothetical protein